ncbi:MAG: hypothetical protein ACE5I3_07500 [Phycisphaerae bacterium]
MDSLVWFFFESTLALGGCLAVLMFVLLVHWRRRLQPRPLLIGLAVALVLLVVQASVVTRREHADRIMKQIEADVVASRPDAVAAALSTRFRIAEPEMDRTKFLDLVRSYMRRVDVHTLTRRALEIVASEKDTFEISISYWADISHRDYSGMVRSRWKIVFLCEQDEWRILCIEPTLIGPRPVDGWRGLDGP